MAAGASLRSGVVLALAVVALAQVFSLLQGVRSVRRLQARVGEQAEQRARGRRARGSTRCSPAAAARAGTRPRPLAIALGVASEVEVLDADGRTVFARPGAAPVAHALRPDQRQLRVGGSDGHRRTCRTARSRGRSATCRCPPSPALVLRLAASAGDLEDELRERQQVVPGARRLAGGARRGAAARAASRAQDRPAAAPAAARSTSTSRRWRGCATAASRSRRGTRTSAGAMSRSADAAEQEAMARAGELTAGIVHEVRNGLGHDRRLRTHARAGRRCARTRKPPRARSARSARRSRSVVRRFADFVRLEELRLGPVDLARLLARVAGARAARPRGRRRAARRPRRARRGPGGRGAARARGRERGAQRRSPRPRAGATSRSACAARRAAARDPVEDDGPGLAPDHPGEIRPFYSTRPGGLGLGLPLARKIMLLHGGDLELSRRPKGGVSVNLILLLPSAPERRVTDGNEPVPSDQAERSNRPR